MEPRTSNVTTPEPCVGGLFRRRPSPQAARPALSKARQAQIDQAERDLRASDHLRRPISQTVRLGRSGLTPKTAASIYFLAAEYGREPAVLRPGCARIYLRAYEMACNERNEPGDSPWLPFADLAPSTATGYVVRRRLRRGSGIREKPGSSSSS